MSVSAINSLVSGLIQQAQGQSSSATTSAAASRTASQATDSGLSDLDSSPAYQLSLGQQQIANGLLGYSQLGQLMRQAGNTLNGLHNLSLAIPTDLTTTHSVTVTQLAEPQVLSTYGMPDAESNELGTGTLSIQMGSIDPADGSFTPAGKPISIHVDDGSLNGVAAAINGADAGFTASVVNDNGQYRLELTGPTGAASAFAVSGIDALSYDPTAAFSTGLAAVQTAQDAEYSVDGGAVQTSSGNTVSVAGATTTFSAIGTTTVKVRFGEDRTESAAQTLVNTINALIASAGQLTGSGGALASDQGLASGLADSLGQVLTQVSAGSGSTRSLADIGITQQSDGSFAIDTAKLQQAYADSPDLTRRILDAATNRVQDALNGSKGSAAGIKDELKAYAQALAQTPSLIDVLNQSSSSADASNPFTGSMGSIFGGTDSLLAALQQGNSSGDIQSFLASLTGQGSANNTDIQSLLASVVDQASLSDDDKQSLLAALGIQA